MVGTVKYAALSSKYLTLSMNRTPIILLWERTIVQLSARKSIFYDLPVVPFRGMDPLVNEWKIQPIIGLYRDLKNNVIYSQNVDYFQYLFIAPI